MRQAVPTSVIQPATSSVNDEWYLTELGYQQRVKTKKVKKIKNGEFNLSEQNIRYFFTNVLLLFRTRFCENGFGNRVGFSFLCVHLKELLLRIIECFQLSRVFSQWGKREKSTRFRFFFVFPPLINTHS